MLLNKFPQQYQRCSPASHSSADVSRLQGWFTGGLVAQGGVTRQQIQNHQKSFKTYFKVNQKIDYKSSKIMKNDQD